MNAIKSDTDAVGIVLAAGRGSRMRSRIPKPLHTLAGRELIRYPIAALEGCGVSRLVVVTSPDNGDAIAGVLGDRVRYAVQAAPDGTADAVACGLRALPEIPRLVIVLAGDTPLVRPESILGMMADHRADPERRMTILSAVDAFGPDLGHIKRTDPRSPGTRGDLRRYRKPRSGMNPITAPPRSTPAFTALTAPGWIDASERYRNPRRASAT